MATATQEKISRPMIPASELDRLASVMAREGVTGKPAELLTELLNRFEEGQEQEAQSGREVTNTMQWFISQIDELKAQMETLARERDDLLQQVSNQVSKSADQTTSEPTIQPIKREPAPPRISSSSRSKVDSIIDALIAWNTAQENRSKQVRISVTVIKALGKLIEATYQPAIQEALKERADEIEEVHSRFMLGARHNRSIENKDDVVQAIARDYLGVDNWQDASFG